LEIQVHVALEGNGQTLTRVNASGIYNHINTFLCMIKAWWTFHY